MSDIGVVFLPPKTPYFIQPATKLIEYTVSGLIPIANVSKYNNEILNNISFAYLFENNLIDYSQKLLKAIKLCMDGKNNREERISEAIKKLKSFDWEVIVDRHVLPNY
jgi:hypothetical protein